MFARLLCFGNGTLRSLHDRSNGFYRRQIILQTKTRPADRVDDPFLKEKLLEELPGILNWCLEGLLRLRKNNYRFTVSTRSRDLKEKTIEADNNMKAFLESEGYIAFETGARCTTEALYSTYAGWCADNAEKPLATITFSQYLNENAEELGIERCRNIINSRGKRVRGFIGLRIPNPVMDGLIDLPADYEVPF